MEFTIEVEKYLSEEEIREIAMIELRQAFKRQFHTESDVERVLSNLTMEYVFNLVSEYWNGDFEKLLHDKIKEAIESNVSYYVFRRADVWDRTESPAVKILDEECQNSRPLIKEMVEKHIKEYPFEELNKEQIGDVMWDVIMNKILGRD